MKTKSKRVTIYNGYHGTKCEVLVPRKGSRILSRAEVRRIRAKLCSSKTCTCGDVLGTRMGKGIGEAAYQEIDGGEVEIWLMSSARPDIAVPEDHSYVIRYRETVEIRYHVAAPNRQAAIDMVKDGIAEGEQVACVSRDPVEKWSVVRCKED